MYKIDKFYIRKLNKINRNVFKKYIFFEFKMIVIQNNGNNEAFKNLSKQIIIINMI